MGKLIKTYLTPHPPIIIPEIGMGSHNRCENTYKAMQGIAQEIKTLAPKRIILISPHGTVFSDGMAVLYNEVLSGDLSAFGHPEIRLTCKSDRNFIDQLTYYAGQEGIVLAKVDKEFASSMQISPDLDHGALVPLWFLKSAGVTVELVHITYGLLPITSLYRFGMLIKQLVKKATGDTVLLASGDLSHALEDLGPYAYNAFGHQFDRLVRESFEMADPYKLLSCDTRVLEGAKACGFRSLAIAWGALDRMLVKGDVHSYEGPFGVGYLVASLSEVAGIRPSILDELDALEHRRHAHYLDTEDDYVRLARQVINVYIKEGKRLRAETLADQFAIAPVAQGCFVSLKTESGLRGCIGTIYPTRSLLIEEIIDNAIKAASEDPRFDPVEEEELDFLKISVDVLNAPERVTAIETLDPKRYGVIVTAGLKKGLLLPNLDGVDTIEDQLQIAKSKAGITDEPYVIDRFEVVRHEGELL